MNNNVCLHNHTQNSIKDSVMSVKTLVKKAKELGYKSIALTDHGTLTGCYDFYNTCKKEGLKPILGCELYVNDYSFGDRLHMVVMAKDYIGYQAIIKAVKISNKNQEKVGTLIFPITTSKILEECFGEGSLGHDHVIATSACISGVIAGLVKQNQKFAKLCAGSKLNENELDDIKIQIAQFEKKLSEAESIISDKSNDSDKIEYAKKVKSEAKKKLKELQKQMAPAIEQETMEKILELYKPSNSEMVSFMESEALRYQKIFGKGNFFIELQYHYMKEEKLNMFTCDVIAEKNGIPTCAANDAHMPDGSDASILARQTINGLRFNNIEEVSASEKELYVKSEEQVFSMISEVVGPTRAAKAMSGNDAIYDACNISFPEKPNHYPVFDKTKDAMVLLREEVEKGIENRFNGQLPEGYRERIEYELDIIKQLNVADYILIVQDLLRFGRKLGKMPVERFDHLSEHIYEMTFDEINEYVDEDQSYFGYPVGPGRGSSAGSEVCYLIGIVDIDPIPYNLLFERFLNPERVSMPDIDSDYANGYRDLVIAYTYKKYGTDAVCRMVTFGTNSAKKALKDVARAVGKTKAKKYENTAGKYEEVISRYQNVGDMLSKVCSGKPGDVLRNYDEKWLTMDKDSREIVNRAKSIEGSYSQYGMHACGVIISDNSDVSEYIPLMWDSSNQVWKAQLTPPEAEDAGLLKMDYLGLKNLNIITEIIRLIEKRHGIRINPSTIPVEKECIKAICHPGNTNSIFQLESSGMKSLCRQMKPDTFEDIIAEIAVYRPGPMESIPAIISVKTGAKEVEYLVPELEHILNVTYGKPLYQEQVQQIFRDLAGYSFGQADNVRRAMAKKKEAVLLAEREAFIYGDTARNIDGCVKRGIDAEKANKLFDEMVDFAKYAFNKSHAAVYARVAYIMMYLKYHYYIEFMTVVLKWASQKKIAALINECTSNGIKLMVPDINLSDEGFKIVGDDILFGLKAIKGVNDLDDIFAARKEKEFSSFKDFVLRTKTKSNVIEALIKAGAFDSMISSRKAGLLMLGSLLDIRKSISEKEEKIDMARKMIRIIMTESENVLEKLQAVGYTGKKKVPSLESKKKDLEKYEKELQALKEELDVIEEPNMFADETGENLKYEKEYLGVYITGHPTDSYIPMDGCVDIDNLEDSRSVKMFGVIDSVKLVKTKKANKDMAFFTLEDKTGSVEITCFPSDYEILKDRLNEGNVVNLTCSVQTKTIITGVDENGDDIEETEVSAIVKTIENAKKKTPTLMVTIGLVSDWLDVYPVALSYETNEPDGCNLIAFISSEGICRKAEFKVSRQILMDPALNIKQI